MSGTKAQQVFDAMNATSCNPLTVPPPCIPFLYPDDGCWARAHEMCRLMIVMGHSPRKVWIQGNLCVSTKNKPNCVVWWGWHVAPTLCVRGPKFFQTQTMVIDPSLFTTPVSKATWKGVQGDPNATLTNSEASDYLWGTTDPTYVLTNQKLGFYHLHSKTARSRKDHLHTQTVPRRSRFTTRRRHFLRRGRRHGARRMQSPWPSAALRDACNEGLHRHTVNVEIHAGWFVRQMIGGICPPAKT